MPGPQPRSPRSRWFPVLLAGLAVWTAVVLSLDVGHFGLFQDDGLYLTSARSLRDGRGYGLLNRPGEPPPKYPIGLPAVLALALRLDPGPPSLGREVAVARALVVVAAWVFFLAAHAWLRRLRVGPGLACAIVLATAFQYVVALQVAITLMADLPFAAVTFVLLARWAGRRADCDATGRGLAWRQGLADGMLAGFAFLLRSNGITLIAAGVVAALAGGAASRVGRPGRRPRPGWSAAGACLLGAILVAAPATWYAGRHPRVVASNSYLVELSTSWTSPGAGLAIVGRNLWAATCFLPASLVSSSLCHDDASARWLADRPLLEGAFRLACTGVIGLGLVRLARATRWRDLPAWTHALGTVAIFAAWPWTAILERFLLTLIPLLLLALAVGLGALARAVPDLRADPRARRRLAVLGLAALTAGNAVVVVRAVRCFHAQSGQWTGFPDRAALDRMLGLIRARTGPDAVIASFWPEMVYLQTGRMSVPLAEDDTVLHRRFGDVARLRAWRDLAAGRPFYLLHRDLAEDPDRIDARQVDALLAPVGEQPRLAARLVARTPDGRYQLSEVVEPVPDEAARHDQVSRGRETGRDARRE